MTQQIFESGSDTILLAFSQYRGAGSDPFVICDENMFSRGWTPLTAAHARDFIPTFHRGFVTAATVADVPEISFEAAPPTFKLAHMASLAFLYTHRVTYSECTLGNHVYYARYLDMLESARGEFFRQLGLPLGQLQEDEIIFPVAECHLRYRAPARYDDVLTVEVRVTAAGRARLNFGYRVVNQAAVLVLEAETFHVCAGLNEKPRRLPEGFVERLAPYTIAKLKPE